MTEYNLYNAIKEQYNNSNSIARKISKNDYIKFVDLIKTPDDAQIKDFVENVLKKIDSNELKNLLEGLPDDGENSLKKMFENIIRNNNKFKNLYYFSNYTFIKIINEIVLSNKKNTEKLIKHINEAATTTQVALESSSSNASNISSKLSTKDKEIEELKKQLAVEKAYIEKLKASFGKIKINLDNLNNGLENSNTLRETVNMVKKTVENAESLANSLNNSTNEGPTAGGACKKCGSCKKCISKKRKKKIVKN